jgi:hypothetical protein
MQKFPKINLDSLPDPTSEDLEVLTDMLPGLLAEGTVVVALRLAPGAHDVITVSLKSEHCDLSTQPADMADPSMIWVWDRIHNQWRILDISLVVAAESWADTDDIDQ